MSRDQRKPLVYVAGPITGDPFGCVREAVGAMQRLMDLGCVPFLPQLSILAEMVQPFGYETWMTYDFDVIAHCDAMVRLEGESPGADREVKEAGRLGIPIFRFHLGRDVRGLCEWVEARAAAQPIPSGIFGAAHPVPSS